MKHLPFRAIAGLSLCLLPLALPQSGVSQQFNVPFEYEIGSSLPSPVLYSLTGTGALTLQTDNAAWVSASLSSNSAPAILTIGLNSISVAGLAAGNYTSIVTVTSQNTITWIVSLAVTNLQPVGKLIVSPTNLAFQGTPGGGAIPQSLAVTSSGQPITYVASADAAWLSVIGTNPTASGAWSGTTPGTVSVFVSGNLPAGTYGGTITLTSAQASNSPLMIPVTLTVAAPSVTVSQNNLAFASQAGATSFLSQTIGLSSQPPVSFRATITGGTWLSVSPNSGTTPVNLTATVNPSGLAVGTYSGAITVLPSGGTATRVSVTLVVTAPAPTVTSVDNAASFAAGGIAQGSLFSIFGSSLGADQPALPTSFPLPSTVGRVSVQINGHSAYPVFVSSYQINVILPSEVPTGVAQVIVSYNGQSSAPFPVLVVTTDFGAFFQVVKGNDVAVAQNYANGAYPLNSPSKPTHPGDIVIVWGTGLGGINGPDNVPPGNNATDMTNVPVEITVGGVAAQRLYAGRQPQSPAVDNVYFKVPDGVPYGCLVPVAITAGGVAANVVNIAITADGSPCQ